MLVKATRAMIFSADVSISLWPEAMAYACYIKNCTPHRKLVTITPHEAFWGKKPDIRHICLFGSKFWVYILDQKHHKLKLKAQEFIFARFSKTSLAHCYWSPQSHQILTLCNTTFMPNDHITLLLGPVISKKILNKDLWS
jgi:hypothetical protein